MSNNKANDFSSQENKVIISAPLVIKKFVKKNGVLTDMEEFYIRRSIKDYYIKFCESNVTMNDLEDFIPKSELDIIALKMEVEFREGSWDICDDNLEQQSRIGEYVIIHKIIK